jgi:hypothetical protein
VTKKESKVKPVVITDPELMKLSDDWWAKLKKSNLNMGFTDDELKWMEGVDEWHPSADAPAIPPQDAEAIATGAKPCLFCEGRRTTWVKSEGVRKDLVGGKLVDVKTGKFALCEVVCKCGFAIRYFHKWNDSNIVPPRYKWVDLYTLKPSSRVGLSLGRQEKILAQVRENPDMNYLLTGLAGTGKTTISTALFREAIETWAFHCHLLNKTTNAVWRISANQICQELWAYKTQPDRHVDGYGQIVGSSPPPSLQIGDVKFARKEGLRPCLFLEEMDKIAITKSKLDELFKLIDCFYENLGQVVITSNKSARELVKFLGPDHGPQIVRRLLEKSGGVDDPGGFGIAFTESGV